MASPLPDVCIAGAGIIGLSLALELDARGASVTVLDAGTPLGQASSAAAGMLAAHDPENPLPLQPLADLSLTLYPTFLDRIHQLSGIAVPFQTSRTLQAVPPGHSAASAILADGRLNDICPALAPGGHRFVQLDEHSLDPRQLGAALLTAIGSTRINLYARRHCTSAQTSASGVTVATTEDPITAAYFVDCTGAWSGPPIVPKKGQMLSVELPPSLVLDEVIRTPEVYIVPRIIGPQAGRAVIGATVEDAGFDTTTRGEDIAHLRSLASALLPSLTAAPIVEQWAGLRLATPDELPILGLLAERRFIAAGHYRNGILLAPATAQVLAQMLTGDSPALDLTRFSPSRFDMLSSPAASDIRSLQP
jgi:glycine oxidase